jgi:hypothetical protein
MTTTNPNNARRTNARATYRSQDGKTLWDIPLAVYKGGLYLLFPGGGLSPITEWYKFSDVADDVKFVSYGPVPDLRPADIHQVLAFIDTLPPPTPNTPTKLLAAPEPPPPPPRPRTLEELRQQVQADNAKAIGERDAAQRRKSENPTISREQNILNEAAKKQRKGYRT